MPIDGGMAVSTNPTAPWGSDPPPLSRAQMQAEGEQLLKKHDYERGWLCLEARTEPGRRGFVGTLADLRGKVLLVRGEFGSGDCIIMMRYLPLLQKYSGCK
jgi:hypothetical protein